MTETGVEPAISWSHWVVVRRDAISPHGHDNPRIKMVYNIKFLQIDNIGEKEQKNF